MGGREEVQKREESWKIMHAKAMKGLEKGFKKNHTHIHTTAKYVSNIQQEKNWGWPPEFK